MRLLGAQTHEAMMRGIRSVRPGRPVNVIGRVIESYAKRCALGVVRDYTGHGVGPSFHTKPTILHYDDPRATTLLGRVGLADVDADIEEQALADLAHDTISPAQHTASTILA